MADEDIAPPKRRGGLILVVVALVAVAAIGAWLYLRSSAPPTQEADAGQPEPVDAGPPPAPKLSITDGEALLRKLGQGLSNAKELQAWLAESDILRRLVAAVNLTADGKTPAPVLGFLKPSRGFEVVKKKKKVMVSPKNGAGYDAILRVLKTIDPAAAGKAYVELRPYADTAYAEIGPPGRTFDARIREAIGGLVATPIPSGQQELVTKGLGWAYKDPTLEGLTAAQKQLLRMGPNNARATKDWLGSFQAAIH
jgi:hypothetical protein